MLRTRLLLILLLLSTGFFANVYNRQLTGQSSIVKTDEKTPLLEAYFNSSHVQKLNEQGHINSSLDANQIKKFINQPDLLVQQPLLNIKSEQELWRLSANNAVFNTQNNTLLLEKNVLLEQMPRNNEQSSTLKTEILNINLDNRTARSDVMIHLNNGQSQTTAQGIEIDLVRKTVLLSNRVRSQITPQKKPVQR